jgi:hypothetical protein
MSSFSIRGGEFHDGVPFLVIELPPVAFPAGKGHIYGYFPYKLGIFWVYSSINRGVYRKK